MITYIFDKTAGNHNEEIICVVIGISVATHNFFSPLVTEKLQYCVCIYSNDHLEAINEKKDF